VANFLAWNPSLLLLGAHLLPPKMILPPSW
jgi:hypothetical protein